MLLDADTRPVDLVEAGLRLWENDNFAIGWKGHLYLPGEAAGTASVGRVAASLSTGDLADVTAQLAGVFALFVFDKARARWSIACDNTGLFKIFYDHRGISTSLLELLKDRDLSMSSIDTDALVEYLALGAVLGPRTFLTNVAKLQGRDLLELPPAAEGGLPRLWAKRLPDVLSSDPAIVLDRFAALSRSFGSGRASGEVSVDATGGFDNPALSGSCQAAYG